MFFLYTPFSSLLCYRLYSVNVCFVTRLPSNVSMGSNIFFPVQLCLRDHSPLALSLFLVTCILEYIYILSTRLFYDFLGFSFIYVFVYLDFYLRMASPLCVHSKSRLQVFRPSLYNRSRFRFPRHLKYCTIFNNLWSPTLLTWSSRSLFRLITSSTTSSTWHCRLISLFRILRLVSPTVLGVLVFVDPDNRLFC